MDKKTKKIYDKAMNYYEKGKINKALEVCEIALSQSLKNPEILNFKGLLLYQRGELDGAITVWKINKDFNNDSIAGNYIKDAEADKRRNNLYIMAEKEIKQLKIDRAIELLKECKESDFNSVKVNTALALCYQKKGEFKIAKEYADRAVAIDENAITAKTIIKDLLDSGVYERKTTSYKSKLIATTIVIAIIAIISSAYIGIKRWNNNKLISNNQNTNSEAQKNTNLTKPKESINSNNKKSSISSVKKQTTSSPSLDVNKLTKLIASKDLDGIYGAVEGIKEESLSNREKGVYRQAVDLLKVQGIETFYNKGLEYFNQKNYESAVNQFNKAYKYSEGSYLRPHVIFYIGNSSSQMGEDENAIKKYEEYYNNYPNGAYSEGVLYDLALLNKKTNKEKSKTYASKLVSQFPNSSYINDIIKGILAS